MQPNKNFCGETPQFWALVKFVSGQIGYSSRSSKKADIRQLRAYQFDEVSDLAAAVNLDNRTTNRVYKYLNFRSKVLNNIVQHQLMNREEARKHFERLNQTLKPKCYLPFNKQKGVKRHLAYFTCIVNILTESYLGGSKFEDNPGQLVTISDREGRLVETLSRRIDGAYPSLRNPKTIWEIKEYYGTTTFGSRVADGVYETQLDGYELKEAAKLISHPIKHYLLVDDKYTWWECGRSYLCRLVDIMHIGLVDEVIFGKEVLSRWPLIVKSWK